MKHFSLWRCRVFLRPAAWFGVLLCGVCIGGVSCTRSQSPPPNSQQATKLKIEDVQRRHEQQLMAIPGVTAIGIGEENGQPVIKVFVKQRTEELNKQLPQQLEGFKVKVEVSGEIRAY